MVCKIYEVFRLLGSEIIMAERDTKATYLLHLLRIYREHLYLLYMKVLSCRGACMIYIVLRLRRSEIIEA